MEIHTHTHVCVIYTRVCMCACAHTHAIHRVAKSIMGEQDKAGDITLSDFKLWQWYGN
jgi:hypothetical protein